MSGVSGSQVCSLQAFSSVLPSVAIEVALVHTQNGSELSSVTIKQSSSFHKKIIFLKGKAHVTNLYQASPWEGMPVFSHSTIQNYSESETFVFLGSCSAKASG